MKILPPPIIADLDELIDVVLHPEKLVARTLRRLQVSAFNSNMDNGMLADREP